MRIRARKLISLILLLVMILYVGAPQLLAIQPTSSKRFSLKTNDFKYSGYYEDSESLLDYLKARYYSPELMRFINRDTYDLSNRYAYGDGDPIANVDPEGHSSIDAMKWTIPIVLTTLLGFVLPCSVAWKD